MRYVLEGSVHRSGNQVRVSAQLADAETGAHLWAERFDCGSGDLLRIQDDITRRIASELGTELMSTSRACPRLRPTRRARRSPKRHVIKPDAARSPPLLPN